MRRFIEDPRAVDAVVVVLATWFVLGGYVTAFAYVSESGHVLEAFKRAGFTAVTLTTTAIAPVGTKAAREMLRGVLAASVPPAQFAAPPGNTEPALVSHTRVGVTGRRSGCAR